MSFSKGYKEKIDKYQKQALVYSISSSECEKNATNIERDFDNLYETIYMKRYIGKRFSGVISSVTSFGIFVSLDNTVEGMVPFSNMPQNDYYEYDDSSKLIIGRKTKKVYKIGDRVSVRVVRADTYQREIDFEIIGD